jgi:hypothetical protein
MHVDCVGTPRGAVIAAAVLVLADEFLLLGVNRNDRLAGRLKRRDLAVDVLELPVAVGVVAALFGLAIVRTGKLSDVSSAHFCSRYAMGDASAPRVS